MPIAPGRLHVPFQKLSGYAFWQENKRNEAYLPPYQEADNSRYKTIVDEINTVVHLRAAGPGKGLANGKEFLIHLLVEPWILLHESLMELQDRRSKE